MNETVYLGVHECVVAAETRYCFHCGSPCVTVEICFEAPFCSEECIDVTEKAYWSELSKEIYPSAWERVHIQT